MLATGLLKKNWSTLQTAIEPFGSLKCQQKPLPRSLSKGVNPDIRSHLESYLDMLYARGYAQNTINTYTSMVSKLLSDLHPTPPES